MIGLCYPKKCFSMWYHYLFTGDMTGKYSVYTLYEGHEIMFHVSTLLPYSRDNRQQVNRKFYQKCYDF